MTEQLIASLRADALRELTRLVSRPRVRPDERRSDGFVGVVDEHDAHHLARHGHAGHLGRVSTRLREQHPGGRAERGPPVGRVLLSVAAGPEIRGVRLDVRGEEAP